VRILTLPYTPPKFSPPSSHLIPTFPLSNPLTYPTDAATGTSTTPPKPAPNEPNTQGVSKADKIRYGQSIQEGGMGGKTTSSTGQANQDGGVGGAEGMEGEEDGFKKERREQGYGGGKDMDRTIGA